MGGDADFAWIAGRTCLAPGRPFWAARVDEDRWRELHRATLPFWATHMDASAYGQSAQTVAELVRARACATSCCVQYLGLPMSGLEQYRCCHRRNPHRLHARGNAITAPGVPGL